MHRLSLGRRALAGLGLSFLYLNLAPATPAAPTPDQSYYWCSRQMTVHGTNVEYVSRVKDEENSFYNWNYACKTSWPYGYIALDATAPAASARLRLTGNTRRIRTRRRRMRRSLRQRARPWFPRMRDRTTRPRPRR